MGKLQSNIVEIKPFIEELWKAACDTWKQPDDEKVFAIPIGHLLEIAAKYTIKTAEGWGETNPKSAKILAVVEQKLETLPEANDL
jgi:hypothetical protein